MKRSKFPNVKSTNGFSIIELVVILVLVGILSAVVISRFVAPSAFNERAAQDSLLAAIRAAQQASMGRSSGTPGLSAVTFEISSTTDKWIFNANQSGNPTPIRSLEIPRRNITLESGSSIPSGSTCANSYDDGLSNFKLEFDNQGNLKRFVNGSIDDEVGVDNVNGVRICVNDTVQLSVCVSPSGYAYAGNCEP